MLFNRFLSLGSLDYSLRCLLLGRVPFTFIRLHNVGFYDNRNRIKLVPNKKDPEWQSHSGEHSKRRTTMNSLVGEIAVVPSTCCQTRNRKSKAIKVFILTDGHSKDTLINFYTKQKVQHM